jgi:WD40 repeat protein
MPFSQRSRTFIAGWWPAALLLATAAAAQESTGSIWQAEPQILPAAEPLVQCLRYSADGNWLIVGHGTITTPGRVRLWNLSGRREAGLWPDERGIASVAISADGQLIAAASWSHRVWLRRFDGMSHSQATELPTGEHTSRLAMSPDGSILVTAGGNGELKIWDTQTGKVTRECAALAPLRAVALSPDGQFIAAGGGFLGNDLTGRVGLWSVASGELVHEFSGHDRMVAAVAFSPDGEFLATGAMDNTVWVFETKSGRAIRTFASPQESVTEVAWSPDGTELAATDLAGRVHFWDTVTGGQTDELALEPTDLFCVQYAPTGDLLGATGLAGSIQFFSAETHERASGLQGGEASPQPIRAIACSGDGNWMATAGVDGEIHLRDPQNGRVRALLSTQDDEVLALAFHPNNRILAAAGLSGTIGLWDVTTARPAGRLPGHASGTYSLAFSNQGQLASGGFDQLIALWDIERGEKTAELTGHGGSIRGLAWMPDGRLVSASADHTLGIWQPETGERLATLSGHEDVVRAVAVSPDGSLIASAGEDTQVRVWDSNGTFLREFTGHTGMVWSVAFAPRAGWLASGGFDGEIRLWPADGSGEGTMLTAATDAVAALAFIPNTADLLAGSLDRQLRRFPARGLAIEPLATLAADNEAVRFARFRPDGKTLVTAGHERTIKLWKWPEQTLEATLTGHSGGITCGDLASDGKLLATGAWDGTIRLWDLDSQEQIVSLREHRAELGGVAFSPDGRQLASCGHDGWFRRWDAQRPKVLWQSRRERLPGRGVAWSPDGKWLIGVTGDYRAPSRPGEAILWDVATGEERGRIKDFAAEVKSARFSPSGERVAIACNDKTVRVFTMPNLQEIAKLQHDSGAFCADFLGSERTIASIDFKGNLQIWDGESGRRLAVLQGHTKWSMWLYPMPSQHQLLSASADGTVRLWSVEQFTSP